MTDFNLIDGLRILGLPTLALTLPWDAIALDAVLTLTGIPGPVDDLPPAEPGTVPVNVTISVDSSTHPFSSESRGTTLFRLHVARLALTGASLLLVSTGVGIRALLNRREARRGGNMSSRTKWMNIEGGVGGAALITFVALAVLGIVLIALTEGGNVHNSDALRTLFRCGTSAALDLYPKDVCRALKWYRISSILMVTLPLALPVVAILAALLVLGFYTALGWIRQPEDSNTEVRMVSRSEYDEWARGRQSRETRMSRGGQTDPGQVEEGKGNPRGEESAEERLSSEARHLQGGRLSSDPRGSTGVGERTRLESK